MRALRSYPNKGFGFYLAVGFAVDMTVLSNQQNKNRRLGAIEHCSAAFSRGYGAASLPNTSASENARRRNQVSELCSVFPGNEQVSGITEIEREVSSLKVSILQARGSALVHNWSHKKPASNSAAFSETILLAS